MKTSQPPSLYNSDTPPQEQEANALTAQDQDKTPYLKAILSGATKLFASENSSPVTNADRLAALRYIKDSALIKKIYVGKISC